MLVTFGCPVSPRRAAEALPSGLQESASLRVAAKRGFQADSINRNADDDAHPEDANAVKPKRIILITGTASPSEHVSADTYAHTPDHKIPLSAGRRRAGARGWPRAAGDHRR